MRTCKAAVYREWSQIQHGSAHQPTRRGCTRNEDETQNVEREHNAVRDSGTNCDIQE